MCIVNYFLSNNAKHCFNFIVINASTARSVPRQRMACVRIEVMKIINLIPGTCWSNPTLILIYVIF